MRAPPSERGAALLTVLALVVLLAGFATVGLDRLKAAGARVTEAEARSEAQLLASAATATAARGMSTTTVRPPMSHASGRTHLPPGQQMMRCRSSRVGRVILPLPARRAAGASG